MNHVQHIINGITGYSPELTETNSGAMEYYNECITISEQLQYITDYANNGLDIYPTLDEIKLVWLFIETAKGMDSSQLNHAWNAIGAQL